MDNRVFSSLSFNLPIDNIDTDQIIPAQFLTTTERKGLGRYCFYHWRQSADSDTGARFARRQEGQQILVAGKNFGCGSSREHAPWALQDMGFRAVVSSQIADIFRANALKNGLLPVVLPQTELDFLLAREGLELRIDLQVRQIEIPGRGRFEFPLDEFSAYCLINGIDSLDFLLSKQHLIDQYEAQT